MYSTPFHAVPPMYSTPMYTVQRYVEHTSTHRSTLRTSRKYAPFNAKYITLICAV